MQIRRQSCRYIVCIVAGLMLAPSVMAGAEDALDDYYEWMLDNIASLEADMDTVAETADQAAEVYTEGGWELAAVGDYGVLAEAVGRAGGLMDIRWGYPPRYLNLDEDRKAVVLFALREDHYEEYLDNAREDLSGDNAFVVVMGPQHLLDRAEEDDMPMDAAFPVHATEDGALMDGADGERYVPTTPTASMAALWVWTAEFVAACTRRGKMPVMHQSYAVDGAKERAEELKGQAFHDDEPEPIPAGELGEQYLEALRENVETFYAGEKDNLLEAIRMARRAAEQGGELYTFVHGHAIVQDQVSYPHSPGYFAQLNSNWHKQKDTIELEEGDFVFCLGYDHLFHDNNYDGWDDKAREAGATLVWSLTDYKDGVVERIEEEDELLINQHWDHGDVVVEVPGYPLEICPTSGYIAQAILRMINAGMLAAEEG